VPASIIRRSRLRMFSWPVNGTIGMPEIWHGV
jgi:hypothetical protein